MSTNSTTQTNIEILRVENLQVRLKKHDLDLLLVRGISFFLKAHKTLAVVGESGCGKTTTANAILRLLPENKGFTISGKIFFEDEDILKLSNGALRKVRGAKIGMIFQDPSSSLNPVFTIGSQVAEMFSLHQEVLMEEAEEKTFAILNKVGFPRAKECFETYPHQLSGGMKQRVMIAMAIALEPKILIADEPTTALDVTVQKEILELLKFLQKETGMAILLITHDMGVVAEMADDVAVMYASDIVEFGSCHDIFSNPLHPYTQALMAARPSSRYRKQLLPAITGIAATPAFRPKGCPFHPRCPFAMEKCKTGEVPAFYQNGKPEHWAKCWLLEDQERSPEK